MARGRKALMIARVVGTADEAVWAELERRYEDCKNRKQRERVVLIFLEFLALNGFSPSSHALKLFVGSAVNQGLKIGSIHTYVTYISKAMRHLVPSSDMAAWRRVIQLVSLCHADAETRKAPDIGYEQASAIIDLLAGDAQIVVAAIMCTGCRCRDIMRWITQRCLFGHNHFAIDVRITKGRRAPDKRVTHRILDVQSLLGFPLHPCLRRMKTYASTARPFEAWTALRVNQSIKLACNELRKKWPAFPKATTYSFRRLYCQSVIKGCEYNMDRASKYTLHCRAEVLCAFYDSTGV
jgi:hypothetical protein